MKLVKIDDEYKKFPELEHAKDEVLKIKEWVQKQPHLPDLEEREVLVFFHACSCHTEITKQTIDLHYTSKTQSPDIFSNIDPLSNELQEGMKTISVVYLDQKTPQGHQVIIAKLSDCDPSKFDHVVLMKLYCMCFDFLPAQEGVANGVEVILDLAGFNLGHLARMNLFALKRFMYFLQEAVSLRIAGIHYVNLVPFMDKLLGIMKPLLKGKLFSILHMHTSLDSFYEYVPKEILPADYGGDNKSMVDLADILYRNMRENRAFFLNEEATRRVSNNLRPGKPKNALNLIGIPYKEISRN